MFIYIYNPKSDVRISCSWHAVSQNYDTESSNHQPSFIPITIMEYKYTQYIWYSPLKDFKK